MDCMSSVFFFSLVQQIFLCLSEEFRQYIEFTVIYIVALNIIIYVLLRFYQAVNTAPHLLYILYKFMAYTTGVERMEKANQKEYRIHFSKSLWYI